MFLLVIVNVCNDGLKWHHTSVAFKSPSFSTKSFFFLQNFWRLQLLFNEHDCHFNRAKESANNASLKRDFIKVLNEKKTSTITQVFMFILRVETREGSNDFDMIFDMIWEWEGIWFEIHIELRVILLFS